MLSYFEALTVLLLPEELNLHYSPTSLLTFPYFKGQRNVWLRHWDWKAHTHPFAPILTAQLSLVAEALLSV